MILVSLRKQADFGRILKLDGFITIMIVQTKCKLTMLSNLQTVLYSEQRNSKQIELGRKQKEHEQWQSEISPEYRC